MLSLQVYMHAACHLGRALECQLPCMHPAPEPAQALINKARHTSGMLQVWDLCREALQGYVSSIDEDLAMLREEELPPRVAKAVQVCAASVCCQLGGATIG